MDLRIRLHIKKPLRLFNSWASINKKALCDCRSNQQQKSPDTLHKQQHTARCRRNLDHNKWMRRRGKYHRAHVLRSTCPSTIQSYPAEHCRSLSAVARIHGHDRSSTCWGSPSISRLALAIDRFGTRQCLKTPSTSPFSCWRRPPMQVPDRFSRSWIIAANDVLRTLHRRRMENVPTRDLVVNEMCPSTQH